MPDGKLVVPQMPVFKSAVAMRIRCMYHKKESRFSIHYYDSDELVIIRCIECKPDTEVVRFKIKKEESQ